MLDPRHMYSFNTCIDQILENSGATFSEEYLMIMGNKLGKAVKVDHTTTLVSRGK